MSIKLAALLVLDSLHEAEIITKEQRDLAEKFALSVPDSTPSTLKAYQAWKKEQEKLPVEELSNIPGIDVGL